MDFKRREEIISKDVMTVAEVSELLACDKSMASRVINDIKDALAKEGIEPRIKQRGKLHTQDYMDYFRIQR